MTLGFWGGFLLGVVVTVIVGGYFYLRTQERHDAKVLRLEAKGRPVDSAHPQDYIGRP